MKCPGQDMQYWNDDAIYDVQCPECDKMVEFYKDDTTRKCRHCGHRFVNPKMDFGCAAYCQFAEQCLGTLPEEFVMSQDSLLKDKVAVEVKRHLKNDFASISLAGKIASYAEELSRKTDGVQLAGILCSAYLLIVGNTSGGKDPSRLSKSDLQDISPEIAHDILRKLGAQEELIIYVCDIIKNNGKSAHNEDPSFNVVNDAYYLAILDRDLKKNVPSAQDVDEIQKRILTEPGREEAKKLYASSLS